MKTMTKTFRIELESRHDLGGALQDATSLLRHIAQGIKAIGARESHWQPLFDVADALETAEVCDDDDGK